MENFIIMRLVFFALFFINIAFILLTIELGSRIISRIKSHLRKERESIAEWHLAGNSTEMTD